MHMCNAPSLFLSSHIKLASISHSQEFFVLGNSLIVFRTGQSRSQISFLNMIQRTRIKVDSECGGIAQAVNNMGGGIGSGGPHVEALFGKAIMESVMTNESGPWFDAWSKGPFSHVISREW